MPDDDNARVRTLTKFLVRSVKDATRTRDSLKALSIEAFSKLEDGTTVIEVTFEGGATRAGVNCPPHILLEASEAALSETDPDNPFANASERNIYADHSGGRIET